jgi:hypothetical protein
MDDLHDECFGDAAGAEVDVCWIEDGAAAFATADLERVSHGGLTVRVSVVVRERVVDERRRSVFDRVLTDLARRRAVFYVALANLIG